MRIRIDYHKCSGCGECVTACPLHVIEWLDDSPIVITDGCIQCSSCTDVCEAGAILVPTLDGRFLHVASASAADQNGGGEGEAEDT